MTLPAGQWKELSGGERESGSLWGQSATREIVCRYDERYLYLPTKLAPHPGFSHLRFVEYDIEPHGQGNVKLTLGYALVTSEEDAPRLRFSIGVDVLQWPARGLTFDTSSVVLNEPVNIRVPLIGIEVEITRIEVPLGIIQSVVGKVNNATWQSFPAEAVLFDGFDTEHLWDSTLEIFKYRCRYQFTARPKYPYNLLPDITTGLWDKTTPRLYETGDFTALGLG